MQTGTIIKRIREDKGLMQKEVSAHLGIGNSNYNKLENGHRDLSVDELQKLAILFNMTTDEILNYGNVVPTAIKVEGKPDFEKLHLINQLQEDDKQTVYKIIDTMLTKQKFQTFFEQNLQISK
jgi:transcriptional regulator with XRE-family HTH domain